MKTLVLALVLLATACSGRQQTSEIEAHDQTHDSPESKSMDHEHGAHHHDPAAHKHDGMQHRFEDAERWAQVFDNPERDAWQRPDEVVALMKIVPGSTVADIGAGTGYFLPYLSKAVGKEGRVLALDIEPNLVEYMTKRAGDAGLANVEARVIAPDDPQVDAGSVDRVLIVNTWHHIAEREAYSLKLEQALSAEGEIYIVDFEVGSERGPKHHKLPPEAVVRELVTAGLQAEAIAETLPDQYIVKAYRPR